MVRVEALGGWHKRCANFSAIHLGSSVRVCRVNRLAQTDYTVKMVETPAELQAAQRLRYEVFVQELGGDGAMVDHAARVERDRFDPYYDHMIIMPAGSSEVVGVYRMLPPEGARAAGGYYSDAEYDLAPLRASGRRLLELGRSCLHPAYRGGAVMHHLWAGLARYVVAQRIEVLFGVASFAGTDSAALAAPLSLLHHRHLAPAELRVRARAPSVAMDMIDADQLDRRAAMLKIPSLIKAYLRLGGCVGEGAFVDHGFNTTDVCLIMDTQQMSTRQAQIYAKATA